MGKAKIDRAVDLYDYVTHVLGNTWRLAKTISDSPNHPIIHVTTIHGLTELEIQFHFIEATFDHYSFEVFVLHRFYDEKTTDGMTRALKDRLMAAYPMYNKTPPKESKTVVDDSKALTLEKKVATLEKEMQELKATVLKLQANSLRSDPFAALFGGLNL